MEPLISIIVPIYRVDKYLEGCIESIENQLYFNLEIILIDDGSPDSSPGICDTWTKADLRILTIHKRNGGLSDARNYGMQVATGDYIAFVDSDDIIADSFISALYNAIDSTGASLSACEVENFSKEESLPIKQNDNVKVDTFNSEQALSQLIQGEGFRAVAWNKLYKSSLLENERFEFGKLHEDEFFTYRILDKCEVLAFVSVPLYKYRQREGSIMTVKTSKHMDSLEAGFQRLSFFKDNYPSLYKIDKVTFCIGCASFYSQALNHSTRKTEQIKKQIINYRKKVHFTLKELLGMDLKQLYYVISSMPCFIGLFARRKKIQ